MNRRRKTNKNLPACMYLKHGRYYHVVKGKWHPLSREYSEALAEYARRTRPGSGIAALIDKTLDSVDVSKATMTQYLQVAGRIKDAFREFDPSQVKQRHIVEFLDHHRKTPAMANRMRSVLSLAFKNAVRWQLTEYNPVLGVDPFKEKGRGDKYFSDEDYLKVRSCARPYLALMMDLAYLTGQRVSDIIHLKSSEIKEDRIKFEQEKTGQRVDVEINEAIRETIRAARALRKAKGMYLFHSGRGEPYSYNTVADAFKIARKKSGVTGVQFRDIRAKSATDAEAAGLNPGILLGHRNPQTTNRYLRKRRTFKAVGPKSIRHS